MRRLCGLVSSCCKGTKLLLLICVLLVASVCHGKESKEPRSREKQTWTVAATSPLGGNTGSLFTHWVCFAKDGQEQVSSRGGKLSCCQEIFRLMNHEPQLCWQYPTGNCGDSTRATFLRICSQNLAAVPSYPRHHHGDGESNSLTPARWSFVIANLGAAKQFNPVEFWRQCISFSVSAGHWYYTVSSPYRLATETPSSEEKEDSLATNITSEIKNRAIVVNLKFGAPDIDDTSALLKASFTILVTVPEAVELATKGGKHAIQCSSKWNCNVETKTEIRKESTAKAKKFPTTPQSVTAVLVELDGIIKTGDIQFRLTIPVRLLDDETTAKVISAPVLEASHVVIEGRTYTIALDRKQQFGKPLVLFPEDEDEEL